MRDFPIFTTEYGVSSLVLREIPYRKEAYIRILDVQPGSMKAHMEECIAFCRMAGAERIYAAGDGLEAYPEYTSVVEMRGTAWVDKRKLACLFPVTEKTVARWRQIHNNAMSGVDNGGTLEAKDEKQILAKPGAYFVHDNGQLLGIGWLEENKLLTVASVVPGAGERVMHTLMSLIEGSDMVLEAASTNVRALRLYEKLGFVKTRLVTKWFDCCGPLPGENGRN